MIKWPDQITPAWVEAQLENATVVDACLPSPGPALGGGMRSLELRQAASEAAEEWRLARPEVRPTDITDMEEVLRWPLLIGNNVIRRVVQARIQLRPVNRRHRFSWRQIARVVHADHTAVAAWYRKGIAEIAVKLEAKQAT